MIKSNFIAFLISFIISCGCAAFFYPNWVYVGIVFAVVWCVQLLITILINRTIWWSNKVQVEKLLNERIDKIYSQYAVIQCVNGDCEHKFSIPIRLDRENIMKCPHCNTSNKVLVNLITVKSEHDEFRR